MTFNIAFAIPNSSAAKPRSFIMRSRFAEYGNDEDNLPQGMTRIGYDADTEVFTFSSEDGSIWEGQPGSRYGNLTRVCEPPQKPPASGIGVKTEPLVPTRSAHNGDSEEASAAPNVECSPSGRRRSASRVLLRCVSKVTSSLRHRSDSQSSDTAESSPDALSPDVEEFLFSHLRGQQNHAVPEKNPDRNDVAHGGRQV
ncbi:hypothetical protein KVR01_000839 [Diaporthe batatas]|uniref:uncharacterized protein n=1 Tax=Diaporthe batatas TaxID=748121 RepID=UPI001D03C8C4|nr:uncharacterized protein KVR01_000839 [Diaporthe batatas]KAG8170094.1 hypothetical protein KVR01_000839 [Diaporthe batatas]